MRLQGHVKNEAGQAIPGAAITIWAGDTRIISTETDDEGEFECSTQTNYAGHLIQIEVARKGYQPLKHQLRPHEETIEGLVLVLKTVLAPPVVVEPDASSDFRSRHRWWLGALGLFVAWMVLRAMRGAEAEAHTFLSKWNLGAVLAALVLMAWKPIYLPLALFGVAAVSLAHYVIVPSMRYAGGLGMIIVNLGLLALLDVRRTTFRKLPLIGKLINPERTSARWTSRREGGGPPPAARSGG